jgi:hypothetical protein
MENNLVKVSKSYPMTKALADTQESTLAKLKKQGMPDPRSVSTTFSHNAPITSVDSSALVIRFPTAVGQVPSSARTIVLQSLFQ